MKDIHAGMFTVHVSDPYPVWRSLPIGIERDRWTVNFRPDEQGWNTDCDTTGYGMPRVIAEEIAKRYNAHEEERVPNAG